MNKHERQHDVLRIIQNLDISPSMYKNAVEKYTHLAQYLKDHGIEADMYPQGSFALGTVVRPVAKNEDASYDLDFVCQVRKSREQLSASELRKEVEGILSSSNLYGGKLKIYDKCITVYYADVGGIGFSIDIVPAADESFDNKHRLATKSNKPGLMTTAIAIPKHCEKNYVWITNNPKGYRTWFESINAPFLEAVEREQRLQILQENKSVYATIEEIPKEMVRSSVQRVIQILKYHRDVYYSAFVDGDDTKPISAIIGTIVAQIAEYLPKNLSTFELLQHVLGDFNTYGQHQNLNESQFASLYPGKNLITKNGSRWEIKNPANPEDNLADQWNQDANIPRRFFRWIAAAREDLVQGLELGDAEFRAKMETAFKPSVVSRYWSDKYQKKAPSVITPTNAAKPWKELTW